MNLSQNIIDSIPVIIVSGKIDASTSKDLDAALNALIDQNMTRLVIDMEKVEYLSSSGLRVLMAAQNKLRKMKGNLMLISLQPFVKEVFTITGANRLFAVYQSQAEAINSLKS